MLELTIPARSLLLRNTPLDKLTGWLIGFLLYIPVNRYGHVGPVSSSNHTFYLGKLEQAVNQYFMHILSLVTDNNPS